MSRAISPPSALTRPVVIYQGTCPFCRWAARLVARLDTEHAVGLIAHDDPDAEQLMGQIPDGEWKKSWQLVYPNGRRLVTGEAAVELFQLMAKTRRLGRALARLHLTPLITAIYLLVSSLRPYFSRLASDEPGP